MAAVERRSAASSRAAMASMEALIQSVEETYGSGQEVYDALAARRDRRTRAVLAALATEDAQED